MTALWLTFGACALVMTGIIASEPWQTRPNVLFGVAFDALDLRRDAQANALKRQFAQGACLLAVVLWGAVAAIGVVLNTEAALTWCFLAGLVAYLAATFVWLARLHQAALAYHARLQLPAGSRQLVVDVDALRTQRVLSAWWTLLLVPLAVLGLATRVSGATTAANLVVALVAGGSFIAVAPLAASVRGNPQVAPHAAQGRNALLGYLLAVGVCSQAFGLSCAWWPKHQLLFAALFGAASTGGLLALIAYWLHQAHRVPVRGPVVDDNAHWLFGVVYYNPQDAAVFVEKRVGIGVTLNMARPGAWAFLLGTLGLVAVIVAAAFVWGD